jgi:glycosyltransferase involved in cell wall biosynthesis
MLFSVLICTLEDRKQQYLDPLLAHLESQKGEDVEILTLSNQKQDSIGIKRNRLLQMAQGKFAAFLDDDDWVSDTYIPDILFAVRAVENLDCIGFFGEVYFKGRLEGRMIHSISCPFWTEEPGTYFRPPNHLNPIRLDISRQFKFPNVSFSEDFAWSMAVQSSGLLKREVFLGHKPLYLYKCRVEKKGL